MIPPCELSRRSFSQAQSPTKPLGTGDLVRRQPWSVQNARGPMSRRQTPLLVLPSLDFHCARWQAGCQQKHCPGVPVVCHWSNSGAGTAKPRAESYGSGVIDPLLLCASPEVVRCTESNLDDACSIFPNPRHGCSS